MKVKNEREVETGVRPICLALRRAPDSPTKPTKPRTNQCAKRSSIRPKNEKVVLRMRCIWKLMEWHICAVKGVEKWTMEDVGVCVFAIKTLGRPLSRPAILSIMGNRAFWLSTSSQRSEEVMRVRVVKSRMRWAVIPAVFRGQCCAYRASRQRRKW